MNKKFPLKEFILHTLKNGIICVIILIFLLLFFKCPMKLLFDIPCPGCGMTRAIISLLKFDFKVSFTYNPLAIFVLLALVYFIFIRKFLKIPSKFEKLYLVLLAVSLVVLWILRMTVLGYSFNI